MEAEKPLLLVASGPDQRRPLKVGACRANLDRPSLPRQGLSKQERLIESDVLQCQCRSAQRN